MATKFLPPIAIMQGRLLPPNGAFQAFPINKWHQEFSLAVEAGIDAIEWVYDFAGHRDNPLASDDGIEKILRLSQSTGVGVWSICADYFMENKLVNGDKIDHGVLEHLAWLIRRAELLKITYIILPFVDKSSISNDEEIITLRKALSPLLSEAESANVELHLETDWAPATIKDFLLNAPSPCLKMNYDIGNSASLGFCPNEEFEAFSGRLGSLHVKDRRLGGASVRLGDGAADLALCVDLLEREGFDRWLVLQAARGTDGCEVKLADANATLMRKLFAECRSV